MLVDWADRTSAVLEQWSDPAVDREALAIEMIESNLDAYPEAQAVS
jgi:hypothetical protein